MITVDPEVVIREQRLREALREAPDLTRHLRAKVMSGRVERGIEVTHMHTPLQTDVEDEAGDLYVILVDWVKFWSEQLSVMPPATAVVAWRNYQDAHRSTGYTDAPLLGFRAGTTAAGAWGLVQTLTTWLLLREDRIPTHQDAPIYQDEVAARVWALRAQHGLTKGRKTRDASERPCPACGAYEVRGEFFGGSFTGAELRGDFEVRGLYNREQRVAATSEAGRKILTAIDGVTVRCGACGWAEKPNPNLIVGWLS
jgi:hypothetical protein